MSSIGWSSEQLSVIRSDEAALLVTASAGAGKTRVLVERYLGHVRDEGLRPDQILTITFTNKAAAEMKERIVAALLKEGLEEQAQTAETGPIQTIHSFCERMLKENALEAALDPKFELVSGSHLTRILRSCMREAISNSAEESPCADSLIRTLAGEHRGGDPNSTPYEHLEGAVKTVVEALRGSGYAFETFEELFRDPVAYGLHVQRFVLNFVPADLRQSLETCLGPDFHAQLLSQSKAMGIKLPSFVPKVTSPESDELTLSQSCGLGQLALATWWRLDRTFHELQCLDFTGLEARAVRLLETSEATQQRLAKTYEVVMVDEAQDLNPVQYRLLDCLGSRRRMMVGDLKQSIYGFRGADVELFRERIELENSKKLSRNYRTDAGILRFVDTLFLGLWGSDYDPMSQTEAVMDFDQETNADFEGVEWWKLGKGDYRGLAGYVEELISEGAEPNQIAILTYRREVAEKIRGCLSHRGIGSRIAGGSERFFTRLEVRDLANGLRAVADPSDDFALACMLRGPMAGLSIDSVVLLAKEPGIASRLADFIPPLESDRQKLRVFRSWFEPLSAHGDRLSAWEVLSEIFACSPYWESLAMSKDAVQVLANVRKLIALAAAEPELGPLEYSEMIREIQELKHKEGDAPAESDAMNLVRISTMHNSKGLEFDIVILAETERKFVPNQRQLYVDGKRMVVCAKFGKYENLFHAAMVEAQKARDLKEAQRLMYVALTRAKHRLCICIFPGQANTQVGTIKKAFGETPPPSVRYRTTYAPVNASES